MASYLCLEVCGRTAPCPNSVLSAQFGTGFFLNWATDSLCIVLGLRRKAGSRTRVMVFTGLQSYRFFSGTSSECSDATGLFSRCSKSAPILQIGLRRHCSPGVLDSTARGYVRATAQSHGGWMLLPLRRSASAGRMRETVRFEEVRAARLGDEVRQAAHANADQGFERRAAISASGPRGARTTPIIVHSCQLSVFSKRPTRVWD